MISTVSVTIHWTQWPESVHGALLESLQSRAINHKFLYDSVKQSQKWLALHEAYSPSRTDPDCASIYELSFEAVAALHTKATPRDIHLIGLGCGSGQKEARILHSLAHESRQLDFTPCDVSTSLVLRAYHAALAVLSPKDCHPLVCDLALATDLGDVLAASVARRATRVVTFFGMIPNFEPQIILPRLTESMFPGDCLLFSANLAPGSDYSKGIQKVLALYDNDLTRDWLLSFLQDLGIARQSGQLRFVIEDCPVRGDLKRIAAYFRVEEPCAIHVGKQRFQFETGESLRLFFSYRHTPSNIRVLLGQYGFEVLDQWITKSEEEGVFLCRRRS